MDFVIVNKFLCQRDQGKKEMNITLGLTNAECVFTLFYLQFLFVCPDLARSID